MTLNMLAGLYQRIADDAEAAVKNKDRDSYNNLTLLVVALERAYPAEMAALRDEGLPRE
jgi:hypothetical protein